MDIPIILDNLSNTQFIIISTVIIIIAILIYVYYLFSHLNKRELNLEVKFNRLTNYLQKKEIQQMQTRIDKVTTSSKSESEPELSTPKPSETPKNETVDTPVSSVYDKIKSYRFSEHQSLADGVSTVDEHNVEFECSNSTLDDTRHQDNSISPEVELTKPKQIEQPESTD